MYAVKPMPRPRSLDPADIAAAALELVDREGLLALSMRNVAVALGTKPMSLYRYVADREHLERLMVDHVLGLVDLNLPSRSSWQRRILLLGERVHTAAAAHANVVPLLLTHRHRSAHSIKWGETVLGILSEAGFTGTKRVIAFRCLLSYIVGALQVQHLSALAGEGTRVLSELPADSFPLLRETAQQARSVEPRDEFRRGLSIVLRGLQGSAS